VQAQEVLTAEELKEDFDQFKSALLKRNKGLYLFVSEQEFETHLDSLEQTLHEEKTQIEFLRILSEAIVPIGERHLSIQGVHKKSDLYKKINSKEDDAQPFLPIYTYFENDSTAFILRNAQRDSTIQLPSRLLAINDRKIEEIRDEISQYITQDNGVNSWMNWEISRTLPLKYFYHIDTTSTFKLTWLDSLGTTQVDTLKGLSRKAYRDSITQQSKQIFDVEEFEPSLRFEHYDSLKTGYLKIGTFSENKQKFDDEVVKLKRTVKTFFNEVDEREYENVIIDLRNNTGGSVNLLLYLYSFIQPNEDKQAIFSQIRDRRLWFGEVLRERKSDKQRNPHFDGQVYVLTNGGSYSASVMFSVMAKRFVGAKIVGETAGGRPSGTSAGSFHIERLKHSDILVRIPETVFTYTDEVEFSLLPDIYVKPKLEDFFIYESDHQLAVLLKLIDQ